MLDVIIFNDDEDYRFGTNTKTTGEKYIDQDRTKKYHCYFHNKFLIKHTSKDITNHIFNDLNAPIILNGGMDVIFDVVQEFEYHYIAIWIVHLDIDPFPFLSIVIGNNANTNTKNTEKESMKTDDEIQVTVAIENGK